jgi:hypothetical protein
VKKKSTNYRIYPLLSTLFLRLMPAKVLIILAKIGIIRARVLILGVLNTASLTLTPASLYVNIVHPHCTLRNLVLNNGIFFFYYKYRASLTYSGVYNINVQTGPSLGVMHLYVIALTLTPASSYVNIVYPHCTLRNLINII